MEEQPSYKGETKFFFQDPSLDRLSGMIIAIAAEVSATSASVEALSRLIIRKGLVTEDEVTASALDASTLAETERKRKAFISALMLPLKFNP